MHFEGICFFGWCNGFIFSTGKGNFSYYSEVGLPNIETCLNCELSPRDSSSSGDPVHLLWSRDGDFDNRPNVAYQPNHFVPLFVIPVEETIPVSIQTIIQPRKQVKLTDFLQKGQEKASHIVHESTSGGSKDEKLDFQKKCKTEENDRDEETGAQKARKDQTSSADTHLFPTRGRPTCEQSEVNVNDIGLYVSEIESMTDQEKLI